MKKRKTLLEKYAEVKKSELDLKDDLELIRAIVERWISGDESTGRMIIKILKIIGD